MKLLIHDLPYAVVVREFLDSPNPDHVGWIDSSKQEIQILSSLPLHSARRAIAHEFCHAWIGDEIVPYHTEGFCEKATPLLVMFCDQFLKAGGMPALAKLMGVPFEGDFAGASIAGLELATLSGGELQAAVIRWVLCAELTDEQFQIYRAKYESANLNPLLGDCYPRISLTRNNERLTVELGTTIRAMRRIADRTGQRGPIGNWEWCGDDGLWLDVWPRSKGLPAAARCYVTRTDSPGEKFYGVANWDAFAQYTEIDGVRVYTPFWERMPEHMLAKCAETLAYARAFTQCDGIYIAEQIPIDLGLPARQKARQGSHRGGGSNLELDGQFKERLAALRAESAGMPVEEPAVAVEDERPMPVGRMAKLHREMANAGLRDEPRRWEVIEYVRERAGTLEDDDPDAFGAAVMGELRKRRR